MKKTFLAIAVISLVACNRTTPTSTNVTYIDSTIPKVKSTVLVDTIKEWPIKVTSVEKNVDKSIDMKWQVVTENGVMYYTNTRPTIGDTAFCIDNEDNIIKCKCKTK